MTPTCKRKNDRVGHITSLFPPARQCDVNSCQRVGPPINSCDSLTVSSCDSCQLAAAFLFAARAGCALSPEPPTVSLLSIRSSMKKKSRRASHMCVHSVYPHCLRSIRRRPLSCLVLSCLCSVGAHRTNENIRQLAPPPMKMQMIQRTMFPQRTMFREMFR